MKLTLDPGEQDWRFGDVLRLRSHDRQHEYLYMFVYRKPRYYGKDGVNDNGNDRGFAALCLGVPDCPYPATSALLPCNFDHGRIGPIGASYGGLPTEPNWELMDAAD